MTVSQALNVADRSISFREAEIFLQHILGASRAWLHGHGDQKLTPEQSSRFEEFCRRREQNEPVAYIIGEKEFYGRRFYCDRRALIPRPETEGLIDIAMQWSRNRGRPIKILELGTGSGNIAITLSLELSVPAKIVATDISPAALELARKNYQELGHRQPIRFICADLFHHSEIKKAAPFDLIIANLPYVPTAWQSDPEAQPEVVFQEPDIALFGGEDGLELYRRFFADAPQYLGANGKIIIEFGEEETQKITAIAQKAFSNAQLTIQPDYAGLDRILQVANPGFAP
ncbi:peptide chain release factor N(5)-glutamine methyltransferase [Patescibacteria group bacterium]|nr:peptide chain release factor N(5)-glutamine methyltransferase [Patescibacteria group bacterium]